MGGAHVSMRGEGEGKSAKGATRRRKCILMNAPKSFGLVGPGERWRPMGRGGSAWVELDRPGQIPREDSNEKMIFEFQWNLKFDKALGNSGRRFMRNLDMRVFPKFF
jgi:hypothetical protein